MDHLLLNTVGYYVCLFLVSVLVVVFVFHFYELFYEVFGAIARVTTLASSFDDAVRLLAVHAILLEAGLVFTGVQLSDRECVRVTTLKRARVDALTTQRSTESLLLQVLEFVQRRYLSIYTLRRLPGRAWSASHLPKCLVQLHLNRLMAAEDFVLHGLFKPLLLLLDQLGQLIAVDPIFLDDLCRVHLVIESIMLSLTVQKTRRIILLVILARLKVFLIVFGLEKLEELLHHTAWTISRVLLCSMTPSCLLACEWTVRHQWHILFRWDWLRSITFNLVDASRSRYLLRDLTVT